jgi:Ca2+-binding RTX toxin-like protein
MSTVNVSDASQLTQALSTAHAGDSILLASGTYAPVALSNLAFTQDVTVSSADPSRPAVLTGLTLNNDAGLTFSGLEVAPPTSLANALVVQSSQHISFANLNVHGTMNGDPSDDAEAMLIRDSSYVSVTGSQFQQFTYGIGHLDDDHLTLTGNNIHDIRIDGIRGGGSSWVTIADNRFSDFYPHGVGTPGIDHDDAIQFWTANTTSSAHDIAVTGNIFTRGAGSSAVQGVFLNEEAGNEPYQHVTISNNVIAGGTYNGIFVYHGSDVAVTNNLVAGFPDQEAFVWLDNVTGGSVSGNSSEEFLIGTGVSGVAQAGNTVIAPITDGGAALLNTWLAQHAGVSPPPPSGGGQVLNGAPGGDTLQAPDTNDTVTGGANGANYLRGNGGDDVISGGGQFDDINGNAGNDTAHGNGDDDWVVGGKGDDMLFGDLGGDIVWGNLGADTLDGGDGADQIRGGQGDDVLNGGAGNDFISGDRGSDTVSGGAGADLFHTFSGAGVDRVLDFHLSEGDRVQLDPGTAFTVSPVGADTVIDMGNGDQMILVGVQMSTLTPGWIFGA